MVLWIYTVLYDFCMGWLRLSEICKGLWGNTYPAYIWKEAMLYMIDGKDEADFDLEGKKATGNKNVISMRMTAVHRKKVQIRL